MRVVERNAETLDQAAEAHTQALHKAYWSEQAGGGTDLHGTYVEYVIKETARRVHSTVRVYEVYK
jgi:hypothetical protein